MLAFHIGQRLSYSGSLCTVRYIGPVTGTEGEWLGVEWDNVSRGKHSGEHGGKRYFEAKISNSSTFIRATRIPDPPTTFLEALRNKYTTEKDISFEVGKPISLSATKVFEEVGFDKILEKLGRLRELEVVLLDGMRIVRGDGAVEVLDTCPKIEELDVSRNLWEGLEEIAGVCKGLKMLKGLRISGNRFSSLEVGDGDPPFEGVVSLEINNTLFDWAEIVHILQFFPKLQTLLSAGNSTAEIPKSITLPHTLTTINLEQNAFTSLSSIFPLSDLPQLKKLILAHNTILTVHTPESSPVVFPSLEHLDLSFNSLGTYPLLDLLPPLFPSLTSLRISHNPLFNSTPLEEAHMLVVARTPGRVTMLNYSKITGAERANAELYYLNRIAKEIAKVEEGMEDTVLRDHKRWEELCELHGKPTIDRSIEEKRTLATRLIDVEFLPEGKDPLVKKIPKSLPVSTLKGLVGRMFGIAPLKVQMEYLSPEEGGEYVPLDDDIKEIGFYIDSREGVIKVAGGA
ncbi:L domain-like protein [Tuber magnatum]|uniref:L domain-like protein n=1 Tax=Tuber magnatum TaxID=42249 RepID=A0A317SMX9_9PEZI|nr:L domain-like protein [Tuber magnatum]